MSFADKVKFQAIIEEKESEIERLKACLEQEKIKFNNKLKEIQDYYESILEVMPGHVYWLNKNNVYLGCNNLLAKDIKLLSRKEIIGKTNYDLPWKDQADEFNRLNKLVMDTGMQHTAEEYVVMANGLAIYFSTKTPLHGKDNKIIGILGVSVDITERKKMEVALRRAKEAAEIANHGKTELIANMSSHDIHAPLKGIVGLAKWLEENTGDVLDKQYAHWIAESAQQVIELLHSVLEMVSDEQPNKNDVHEDFFDLRQSLQGIYNLVFPTVKIKNLELILEIDPELPDKLITDGSKIKRVLLNLISNAIKFTEKGAITITAKALRTEQKYVQLQFSVMDTGIGIAEELQDQIFDQFFQVSPAEVKENEEHGVGLITAQNYVGLLGGEIKFESELGKGTHFYFTLPIKVAGLEHNELQHPEQSEKAMIRQATMITHSLQVLLIEANIVARRFIEGLAIQTGVHFTSVSDAQHALELIKEADFDLIITDVELPGFSGEEFARTIRSMEKVAHKKPAPIIGLTTRSLDETNELLQAGMNKIITKPLRLSTMQALLEEFEKK